MLSQSGGVRASRPVASRHKLSAASVPAHVDRERSIPVVRHSLSVARRLPVLRVAHRVRLADGRPDGFGLREAPESPALAGGGVMPEQQRPSPAKLVQHELEGIGTIGMLLNFGMAGLVASATAPPPPHIQHLVDDIRVPRGAGEAHELAA